MGARVRKMTDGACRDGLPRNGKLRRAYMGVRTPPGECPTLEGGKPVGSSSIGGAVSFDAGCCFSSECCCVVLVVVLRQVPPYRYSWDCLGVASRCSGGEAGVNMAKMSWGLSIRSGP